MLFREAGELHYGHRQLWLQRAHADILADGVAYDEWVAGCWECIRRNSIKKVQRKWNRNKVARAVTAVVIRIRTVARYLTISFCRGWLRA